MLSRIPARSPVKSCCLILRRFTPALLLAMALLAGGALTGVCEAGWDSLAVVAQAADSNVIDTPQSMQEKNYVVEGLVVGLLFSGALYAVCRSARRG